MEGNDMPVMEPEDPSAGRKTACTLILCALFCLCCIRDRGSILYGALLFFPVKRVLDGLLDNRIRKIAGGLAVLLLYPILLNSLPLIDRRIGTLFQGKNISPTELGIAAGICFTGIFFMAMILLMLAEKILPEWKIPPKIHTRINAAIFVFTLDIALIGLYFGLDYSNGRFLRLPDVSHWLLPVILVCIGIFAGYRIVRQTLCPEEKKTDGGPQLDARPQTRLSDVAGMDEAKEQIRLRLIEPLRHPKEARKYGLKAGGGVLLYGPPGTGKTFLARAVAGELDLPFYMITAADIFGKYVGESEKNIRELFRQARRHPLSVVFVDELENIFSKRTDSIHETTRKVISIILQELDGVDQQKNPILLLGATNTPWLIDEAFLRPGRFDILAFADLPNGPARMQILEAAFGQSSLPKEPGLLQYLADNTRGYSGADLNGLVAMIQQQAFRRGDRFFSQKLAEEILRQNPPSPKQELIARLRSWEASRKGF